MVAQTPATAAAASNYYLGPLDQISSIGLGEYVEGIHRLGESPFLEVEMSTTGSLLLMKRRVFHRPSS